VKKLYSIYKFLIYIPFLALWTVLNFLGVVVVSPFSPRHASRWFARLWGRGLTLAVPARIQMEGTENIDPDSAYIIVANHLSLTDITVLYGWLKLDLKWIMKKEVRNIPVIGIGCAMLGHIFLDRQNPEVAIRQLQAVKKELTPGTSILFFPEGTRSRDGKLQAFKMGAFKMAQDLEIPVLPVTMLGTDRILTPDGMELFPGTAGLVIHPSISVEEVLSSEPEALRDRARQIIASRLGARGQN
jgi:1-acyl-sn-glycerol-3-phosphate acyltransferase